MESEVSPEIFTNKRTNKQTNKQTDKQDRNIIYLETARKL
jgi:hypothetical protein